MVGHTKIVTLSHSCGTNTGLTAQVRQARFRKKCAQCFAFAGAIKYIIGKPEKTKKEGLHIQGWVQFSKRKYLTGVLKLFPSGMFAVGPCDGTEEQNEKYVKKTRTQAGEVVRFGAFSKQGKSSKLALLGEAIKEGKDKSELWEDHTETMLRHFKGAERMMDETRPISTMKRFNTEDYPTWPQQIDWSKTQRFTGRAGIGKTEYAISLINNPLVVKNINTLSKFNPRVHGGIIFDDFDHAFHKLQPEERIHLVEQDRPSELRVLYGVAIIPAHTKKIFTSNNEHSGLFEAEESISRRTIVTNLQAFEFKAQEIAIAAAECDREVIELLDSDSDSEIGDLKRADAKVDWDQPWDPEDIESAEDFEDTDELASDMDESQDDPVSDYYASLSQKEAPHGFTAMTSARPTKKRKTD